MPPEDWRKLLIARSRPENVKPIEGEELAEDVVDVQLERAVDVLKGIMIFEARNVDAALASSKH